MNLIHLLYNRDYIFYLKKNIIMKKCGFVYIASLSKAYYKAAVNSAISLRDNYPEADITLFTHKTFLQEEDKKSSAPISVSENIFSEVVMP